jgi:hypothetical protein
MAFRPNKSFRAIIDDLGLSTGLQLCLDAGDIASYPGSGQTWTDRSSSSSHFLVGATAGAEASDPTFNGIAGNLTESEFWSFDGGDWFTVATAANPAWIESFHKAGARFTVIAWVFIPVISAFYPIFGNNQDDLLQVGVNFWFRTTNEIKMGVNDGSGVEAWSHATTEQITATGWHFAAFSVSDGATGFFQLDGVQESAAVAFATPSAASASFRTEIGSSGGSSSTFDNNTRLGSFMMWNRALSAAEMMSLYQYPGMVFSGISGIGSRTRMAGY